MVGPANMEGRHGGAWEASPPSDVIDLSECETAMEFLENKISKSIRKENPVGTANSGFPDVLSIPIADDYVAPERINHLRQLSSSDFDFSRLVRLCEELNIAHYSKSHMTIAMIVRAIIDHVPPIFGVDSFSEVASNYVGSKSFKDSMAHLNASLRKSADAHLHVQIRSKEVLPEFPQVDFRSAVDSLLGEIVRILKP